MRSWPIRRKLLAIPLGALALLIVGALWLEGASARYQHVLRATVDSITVRDSPGARTATEALDEATRAFQLDRTLAILLLGTAFLSLLAIAWLTADGFTRRLGHLHEMLSQVLNRRGAPPTANAQTGDEIQRLSDHLHKALFRGRESETQLRRSSEFLEFAQAAGGFGIFDLDLVTGQITGTPLFFDLLGLAGQAIFTRDEWLATVHPEDFEHVVQHLNAAIPAGGKFQVEYRSLRLDGTPRWLAARGQVLLDTENFPARAIGTVTDITERKHLETTLRYATESLNIAQTVAGVATMDLDFGRKSWIASDNFHDILGLPATVPLTDRDGHRSTVHPDDIERVRRAPSQTTWDDPSYRCEYRVMLPDGTLRFIAETASVAYGADGQFSRITGAVVDMTHVKHTEQAAIDARLAAEAANRAKSTFLANVSHEIRTPMNGVIGMTQMLADTVLDHTQREYVDIIRGSAQALLALINDVLDLSKIEADRLDLECVPFDVRDVVYDAVGVMAVQSAAKGIELIVNLDSGPVLARGDPGRLRQIIMNLLSNAIKFTHEGHIVLSKSVDTGADGASMLSIEVQDTGIGIPANRLDRLFKTFSQIDASTTRHYGGSGLGLSIVKRLAELMGGEVGVASEPGRGSTFWVTLRTDFEADQPRYVDLGDWRKVLVVDDVPASLDSLTDKLKSFGFDAVGVTSVDAALARLHGGEKFDLVLADELMPRRGGLDLLAALRADSRHGALPFVLLSLFGAEHDLERWPHRPDAIGCKPIRAPKLAALVRGVLTGAQPPAAAAPPHRPLLPIFSGRHVLLVEDNPVNQRVAQRVLQKLGAAVTIANNGAEALERIAETRFDAVLMDCQMPVMDGFTAARRIRAAEQPAAHGKRLPIIALTANVMSEDRENCIAAGMDAHLGKPLEPSQLADCLSRYLKDERTAAVDLDALRELTGGDAEFEHELMQTFISSGDQCLADIMAALPKSDFETIGKRAHALKGASANIHAHTLSAAAASLETAARSNSATDIDGLVRELSASLHAVNAQLKAG